MPGKSPELAWPGHLEGGMADLEWARERDGVLAARDPEAGCIYRILRMHEVAEGHPRAWRVEWRGDGVPEHSACLSAHPTEADAMAGAALHARHPRECLALGRRRVPLDGQTVRTPWGPSQSLVIYGEGVVRHSAAGHGGFKLSRARNAAVPEPLRIRGGWYEQDSDWARVAVAFPELFTAYERGCAERQLKDYAPDAWEALTGETLRLEESYVKRRRAFAQAIRDRLVVVSAARSEARPGMVEAIATPGGRRDLPLGRARVFLIPAGDYAARGHFGFVIDEDRHEELAPAAPGPGPR